MPLLKSNFLEEKKLTEVLKQLQYKPLSVAEQVSILFAANEGVLDDIDNSKIQKFKKDWFIYFGANMKDLSDRLNAGEALSDDDKKVLKDALESFKTTF